jgi:hypothetical protein
MCGRIIGLENWRLGAIKSKRKAMKDVGRN